MKKYYFIFLSFIIILFLLSAFSIVCATDVKRGDILEYGRDKIVSLYDLEEDSLKNWIWNGEEKPENQEEAACLIEGDRIIVLGFYANDVIKVQFLDGVDYNTYFMRYTEEGIQEDFTIVNEESVVDINNLKKGDKLEYKGEKILSLYDSEGEALKGYTWSGENIPEDACLIEGERIIVLGFYANNLIKVQFLDGADNNEYFFEYVIKDFEPVVNNENMENLNENEFINILMKIMKEIFNFIVKIIFI